MSLEVDKDGNGTMEGSFLFSKKIDELNQETETLIDELEKWQT